MPGLITGRIVSRASSGGGAPIPVPTPTVANVDQLRALTGDASETPAAVMTQVGRGGVFAWDTSVGTDDNGTRFNAGGIGSSSAGWRRVYSGPLEVVWFGDPGLDSASILFSRTIAALPADGGVVDGRGLTGTQAISIDFFSGVTKPGHLLLGQTVFEVSVTINVPHHWTIEGQYGGRTLPGVASDDDSGTVFRWIEASGGTVISCRPTRYAKLMQFTIDGNMIAGTTGILLDAPATNNATHNIEITNFSIYDCTTGIVVGVDSPPGTNNAYEIDKFIISEFHIGSDISGSTGIRIASGNGGSDSIICNGAIQLCKYGIDIVNSAYLKIRHVSCGSLGLTSTPAVNPIAFRIVTGSPILLEQCQSEAGNTGALFISAPSNSYGSSIAPLMIVNCIVNEPISIVHPITIISIGNYAPSGTTAAATITNAGTDLTSIGDTFNSGAGWTFSGSSNQIKKLTGKGFVGVSGLPGTLPTSAPFRVNVGGTVELTAGVDGSNSRPWIQGQDSAGSSTYYGTCISPMGGGVSIGVAGSATSGNLTYANSISNPLVRHDAHTADTAVTNLQIRAQDAYASASSNKNGGALILASGELASGGQAGAVLIRAGAASVARFQGFTASNTFAFEPLLAPTITFDQPSGDVATKVMTVLGQPASSSSTGANRTGGYVYIQGGVKNTGGIQGGVKILDGAGLAVIDVGESKLGFNGTAAITKPSVTGALSTVADAPAKAVLTSIIAALVNYGLVTDGTT